MSWRTPQKYAIDNFVLLSNADNKYNKHITSASILSGMQRVTATGLPAKSDSDTMFCL